MTHHLEMSRPSSGWLQKGQAPDREGFQKKKKKCGNIFPLEKLKTLRIFTQI